MGWRSSLSNNGIGRSLIGRWMAPPAGGGVHAVMKLGLSGWSGDRPLEVLCWGSQSECPTCGEQKLRARVLKSRSLNL
ncbi:hypothetical protein AOLI_G00172750 [Acnodon oligacanthus]